MNRIDQLFKDKKEDILSIYFTAGYPDLDDTLGIIKLLEKHGADLVEVGMPFSDPVADGPVIQQSSQKAIQNGMNLTLLFNQLEKLREEVSIPIILMGYLNPVLKMGMDIFLKKCERTGVDGLILPDLPLEEFRDNYKSEFENTQVRNILLVTPQTPEERIREIDDLSGGFIYMVSSFSTTGRTGEFSQTQVDYFERIQSMNLKNPGLIGFGISDAKSFKIACKYSKGGIIGSSFLRAIEKNGSLETKINDFILSIRQ